jgi:hypothetical protein
MLHPDSLSDASGYLVLGTNTHTNLTGIIFKNIMLLEVPALIRFTPYDICGTRGQESMARGAQARSSISPADPPRSADSAPASGHQILNSIFNFSTGVR